jgi:hypothetical protein
MAGLMLAGCTASGGGGFFSERVVAVPAAPTMQPIVTADGTQQFSVPPEGRAVLRRQLASIMQGQLDDARVSNAWRTAAGAQANPNDYAACVSATAGGQTRYFVWVVRGDSISGDVRGAPAAARCQDPARVVQWVPFTEALVLGGPVTAEPAAPDEGMLPPA